MLAGSTAARCARVLLGAVSSRIVAGAHCPVIVVPRGREFRLELLLGEALGTAAHA